MRIVTVPGYGIVTLMFNSRLARLLGGKRAINNCVTLSGSTIYVSRDYITAAGFAHEWGHILQAKRLGWRYLPWVLWHYLRSGYTRSVAEREADLFMFKHQQHFPDIGTVPRGVA